MNAMQIMRYVASRHLLSVDDLRGPSQAPRIVAARIVVAHLLKHERGLNTGQIGKLLNRTTWTIRYYLDHEFREKRKQRMRRYWPDYPGRMERAA